jgi:hypothetical protein
MKKYSWSFEKAHSHLKEKRKVIKPNPSFMKELLKFQEILEKQ